MLRIFKNILFSLAALGIILAQSPVSAHEEENPFDNFGRSSCTKGWKAKFNDWKEDNPKTYASLSYGAIGAGIAAIMVPIGVCTGFVPIIVIGIGVGVGLGVNALTLWIKTPQVRQTEKGMQEMQELKRSIERNNLLRMLELKKAGILDVPPPAA